ncbi:MAG TPA: SpoIID/LytB domain-containing protein, partial [Paludibacter sp.]|nr:SpoIID/LytB domain-containing protein [Paludibacter sp.]
MKKKEPLIQVGILSHSEILFVLNGYYKASNNRFYTGKKVAVYRKGNILFDGDIMEDLSFEPTEDTCSFDLKNVIIGINFHWQRRENQRFKGALSFVVEGGKLTAVNKIKVEDYLTSVISSEMSATASEELLKAHAVISRSWLLNPIMNKNKNKVRNVSVIREPERITRWYERDAHTHYDVCADDHCQRYQGISRASSKV